MMRENTRSILKQIGCFFVLMALLMVFYYVAKIELEKNVLLNKSIVNDTEVLMNVECTRINDKEFSIYGKFAKADTTLNKIYLILKDVVTNEETLYEIDVKEGTDWRGQSSRWDDYEYEFSLSINQNRIDKKACYEVLFGTTHRDGEEEHRRKISTQKYLYNGEMLDYNIFDFRIPEIADDLIKDVITEGKLCIYCPTESIWIYKKEQCLYWIMSEDSLLNTKEDIKIPVHIYSFDNEMLPVLRQQYGFDNQDFIFNQKEYKSDGLNGYRVAMLKLPTEYEITQIKTGIYDYENGGWIWQVFFQLYEFAKK